VSPTNRFADSDAAARLGQRLFFDGSLSASGEISCATCHDPGLGFGDGKRVSEGIGTMTRNAQALWNVAHQRWFFWDGRADSLWAQCLQPLEHPDEMGATRTGLARRVVLDKDLRAEVEAALGPLPDLDPEELPGEARPVQGNGRHPHHVAWMGMTDEQRRGVNLIFASLGKALEAYERRIVSSGSPFDDFVLGLREGDPEKISALSTSARRGLRIFVGRGQCTLCHTGPILSDREFHNIGLDRQEGAPIDTGRYDGVPLVRADGFNGLGELSDDRSTESNRGVRYVAQKPNNLGEFKTPTLRNVTLTAPYMHDGRFATLEEVVRFYSRLDQEPALGHREETLVPLHLTEAEIADLVAFLESLTGEPLDEGLVGRPQ
jgi:cytochrome c peroxidase